MNDFKHKLLQVFLRGKEKQNSLQELRGKGNITYVRASAIDINVKDRIGRVGVKFEAIEIW